MISYKISLNLKWYADLINDFNSNLTYDSDITSEVKEKYIRFNDQWSTSCSEPLQKIKQLADSDNEIGLVDLQKLINKMDQIYFSTSKVATELSFFSDFSLLKILDSEIKKTSSEILESLSSITPIEPKRSKRLIKPRNATHKLKRRHYSSHQN